MIHHARKELTLVANWFCQIHKIKKLCYLKASLQYLNVQAFDPETGYYCSNYFLFYYSLPLGFVTYSASNVNQFSNWQGIYM